VDHQGDAEAVDEQPNHELNKPQRDLHPLNTTLPTRYSPGNKTTPRGVN
jgi:hypothetical protein